MTPHGILDVLALGFVLLCMAVMGWVAFQVARAELRAARRERRRGGYVEDKWSL